MSSAPRPHHGRHRPAAHGRQQGGGRSTGGSPPLPQLERQYPLVPDPTRGVPAVFLNRFVRQPLIFRKRIRKVDPGAKPGDIVALYADRRDPSEGGPMLLGYGFYNPRSEIAVRVFRFAEELPDDAFWNETLKRAVDYRRQTLKLDEVTDAYRVIHAEGDGIPGLVVDRYGDVLSAEVFSVGIRQRCRELLERLAPLCDTQHHVIRMSQHILSQEGVDAPPEFSENCPRAVTINEHGVRYRVRLDEEAHKTGFFCDQRDNRLKLAEFCEGKSVLDLCCYSGGFAISAKKLGKASEVVGVDIDENPLAVARKNADLNQVRVKFTQSDVFPYMRDMLRTGRRFDVVVLDPPKLIRSRAEIEEGTKKHYDLNRLAIQLVAPGGILLSCTCAGLLSRESFLDLIRSAARYRPRQSEGDPTTRMAERQIRILADTGAAACHPIAGNCPESEYLNAVWMRVDDPA